MRNEGRKDPWLTALNYRPDIDGLRAIAVLLVVFFHAGVPGISGGFVGVDIFFVISGFLITGIIYREHEAGSFSFADFYSRRIRRICPALFALLALCALAGLFLLVPEDLRSLGRSTAAAVLFYANWHFFTQVGYFDGPAIEKPLLHTWSLAVEEQFYLLWPALFLLLYRVAGKRPLPLLLAALFALSLAVSQLALGTKPAAAFYLLPYRAWELLLGALIAVAPAPHLLRGTATLAGAIGLAAIAYAAFAFDAKTAFPGLNAAFPCAGAALLIIAGFRPGTFSAAILGSNPLRFIGKISYSLYLIHWPLFAFAHLALDRPLAGSESAAIVAASIAAAALSWRYIETPARRMQFRFPTLAGVSAAAMAVLVLCGIVFNVTNGLPFRVPKGVIEADAAKQFGGRVRQKADCRPDPLPALHSTLCAIGAPTSGGQYDFVIWGDSHSRHLAAAFSGQAADRGLSGLIISEGGCAPFIGDERLQSWCIASNREVEDWLQTQTKLKAVFLAGIWTVYAENGLLGAPGPLTRTAWTGDGAKAASGIASTIAFLRPRGIQIAIVEDVPFFPLNVASCAARARMFGRDDDRCFTLPRVRFEQNVAQASAILKEIGRRFGVALIPAYEAFCQGDMCRAEKDGVILYRDRTHLNTAGAKYLGSRIAIHWPASDTKNAGGGELKDHASAN